MTAPAKINFKIYQGTTFEQVLRWESETKTYAAIVGIAKAAPVAVTIDDISKLPPTGWRVRVTNVVGMKEINMPEGVYHVISSIVGDTLTLNQINALGFTSYTSGGVVEYNTPVSLAGYTARMQIRKKAKDTAPVITLTTENGGIVLDNTQKTITIRATPEQTALLDFFAGGV